MVDLFINLRGSNVNPKEVLKNLINFKSDLGEIRKSEIKNRKLIFFRDYSFVLSGSEYKAKYGRSLKILTPEQILQKLLILLAQVKAGNTFENLLNEMRQIIYFLYWAKELLKKYINNIMNSIKL